MCVKIENRVGVVACFQSLRTMAGAVLRWIKRRKITVLMLIVTFIVSGLLVNLLQLFTLPLLFINKQLFRVLNAKIVYLHWCSKLQCCVRTVSHASAW